MSGTTPAAALDPKPTSTAKQKRAGPYILQREIGRGAIGVVYDARRDDDPRRRAAVKLLAPQAALDQDERRRLEREWKALGLIEHPNVIKILDHGEVADGQLWFAMELANGPSLDSLVKGVRALEPEEVLFVARGLAAGLSACHARDVAHRDVKPANVVLHIPPGAPAGTDARVLLVDFGLARRRDDSIVVTHVGDVVGSPYYLAPERLKGDTADPRSDLYALGATLLFAATSRPPFLGPDAKAVVAAHLSDPAPRVADAAPGLDPALGALIDELLDKNPEKRPSAADCVKRLDAIQGGKTMPASLAAAIGAVGDDPERTTGGEGPPEPPPLGQFGRYHLEEEIARGGMGVVYRARLPELGRTFALKVMLSGRHAGEQARRRFLREAEAAAALDHPGIVRVHDYGEHEGRAYFVMDLVDGQPLGAWARSDGKAGFDKVVLPLFVRICDAVHYAHSRGTIHRDLKPANILVDKQAQPKILDFGLAKRQGDSADLTTEGELLGTAAYMPPEQAEGRTHDIDTRSDVYALGVILYELSTGGRLPFEGGSVREVLNGIYFLEPSPPSSRANLSWEVDAIVLKALDKEPARRYQSAAAFADDVRRYLDGQPISARRAGALYRFKKLVRREWRTFTMIAIVGVLCLVFLGLELRRAQLRRSQEADAALERVKQVRGLIAGGEKLLAQGEPARAKALFEKARDMDAQAPGTDVGLVRADHALASVEADRRAAEQKAAAKESAARLVAAGEDRLDENDPEAGKHSFVQALAFDPENKAAQAGVARAAAVAYEQQKARERAEAVARARKLIEEGEEHLGKGNLADALRSFYQALGFDPKDPKIHEGLIKIDRAQQQLEAKRRAADRITEAASHLAKAEENLGLARTLAKTGENTQARSRYYDALDELEWVLRMSPEDEKARKLRASAARELARIAREEGRYDLAEHIQRLARVGDEGEGDQPIAETGDEQLIVREADSVLVQRAYREPVDFARGDQSLKVLRDEVARYDKRYQVIVEIRSRATGSVPPKVYVTGIVIRVLDRKSNSTTAPETIPLEGEGAERVVIAGAARRQIGSWDRAIGIDATEIRDKLLAKVKETVARFEAKSPSPPREGRLR